MATKGTKKGAEKNRSTMLVVLFLFALLILVFIFTISGGIDLDTAQTFKTTVSVQAPTAEGDYKTVTASYNIEVNDKDINKGQVDEVIRGSMESFSYEDYTQGDAALETLKTQVSEDLEAEVGFGNVTSIHITDYATGNVPSTTAVEESQENRNGIMKGLFKNMN